ncbi:MAG: PLDc N-terminal domain-containing protein [Acidobacteriota bacterium]
MALIEILIVLIALGIGVVGSIVWIWMIIECATKEPSDTNDKLVWTIIIVFTHIVGALIYLFVRRPARIAEVGV